MCIFTCSERVWKENISDFDDDDTMTFTTMKKYTFRPDLSNGLTGEEIVTTLHPGSKKSIAITYSCLLQNNYFSNWP